MECIWLDAVALGQESVRRAVQNFVARGPRGFGAKKIGNPPGLQRTEAGKPVGDPQPPEEPQRKRAAEIDGAARQSDSHRSEVDKRGDEKFAAGELGANRFQVVESSQ